MAVTDPVVPSSKAETLVVVTANNQMAFNFDFLIHRPTQLRVFHRKTDGSEVELSYPSQFSVTGIDVPSGGGINLIGVPVLVNDKIYIVRDTLIEREKRWQNEGDYKADLVNAEQNDIYMIMQELDRNNGLNGGKINDLDNRLKQEILDRIEGDATLASLIGDGSRIMDAPFFESVTAAKIANIAPHIRVIYCASFLSPETGGAAHYRRVSSEPAHGAAFEGVGGVWWENIETVVNPQMFGAPVDGVSDCVPAFLKMFSYLSTSAGLRGVDTFDGVRKFNSVISHVGHLRFDAGNTQYVISGGHHFLSARGNENLSSHILLTSDYSIGSLEIDVNLPSALSAGDLIRIASNAVNIYDRSRIGNDNKYRTQEFAVVGVGSTTSKIKLQAPLRFTHGMNQDETVRVQSYTKSQNARIQVMDKSKVFEWSGGVFDVQTIGTNGDHYLEVIAYHRPKISKVSNVKGTSSVINLIGTYGAEVDGCSFNNLSDKEFSDNQNGYGVCDGGWFTIVSNCITHKSRHAYTTLQRSLAFDTFNLFSGGMTVGATIKDCVSYLASASHFDSHHGAIDITFENCKAYGGSHAFGCRAPRTMIVNSKSRATAGAFNSIIEAAGMAGKQPEAVPTAVIIGCDLEALSTEAVNLRLSELTIRSSTIRSRAYRQITIDTAKVNFGSDVSFLTRPIGGLPVLQPTSSFLIAMSDGFSGQYGLGKPTFMVERGGSLYMDATPFTYQNGTNQAMNCPSGCEFILHGTISLMSSVVGHAIFNSGNGTFVSFPDASAIVFATAKAGAKMSGKIRVFDNAGNSTAESNFV